MGVYINGPYGQGGTHIGGARANSSGSFSIPVPSVYQDSQPHAYYLYAHDTEGKTSHGTTSFTATWIKPNAPPVVANPVPNQAGAEGVYFAYTIPGNLFSDPDGDPLTTG